MSRARPSGPASAEPGRPRALDRRADRLGERLHVVLGRGVAEREAQGAPGQVRIGPRGQEYVTGLGDPGGAGGSGGAFDALRVQQQEQESPSQPGKLKCALAGRRPPDPGRRRARRPARRERTAATSSSRSPPTLRANSSRRSAASRPATANEATAGTSRVPERTCRSWPPPCRTGTGVWSRPSSSAPMPNGPPILCPLTVIAASPSGRSRPPAGRRPGPRRRAWGSRTPLPPPTVPGPA